MRHIFIHILQVRTAVAARVFIYSQTDLVKGTFHHGAGTQNLRLGPCCLYVLQVLLPDLQTTTFEVMK